MNIICSVIIFLLAGPRAYHLLQFNFYWHELKKEYALHLPIIKKQLSCMCISENCIINEFLYITAISIDAYPSGSNDITSHLEVHVLWLSLNNIFIDGYTLGSTDLTSQLERYVFTLRCQFSNFLL